MAGKPFPKYDFNIKMSRRQLRKFSRRMQQRKRAKYRLLNPVELYIHQWMDRELQARIDEQILGRRRG